MVRRKVGEIGRAETNINLWAEPGPPSPLQVPRSARFPKSRRVQSAHGIAPQARRRLLLNWRSAEGCGGLGYVPSGNIKTQRPARKTSSNAASAAISHCPRRIGTTPLMPRKPTDDGPRKDLRFRQDMQLARERNADGERVNQAQMVADHDRGPLSLADVPRRLPAAASAKGAPGGPPVRTAR